MVLSKIRPNGLWLGAPLVAFFMQVLCVTNAAAESKPYKVGVLYWSMNVPGQVAMREGLEAEAARINASATEERGRPVELLPRVAGDDEAGIERQITQMNELIEAKVDILIVQPTDNAALARPLRKANAAHILLLLARRSQSRHMAALVRIPSPSSNV